MNSLEFIESEIKSIKVQIRNAHNDWYEEVYTKKLQILQQIKSELEAWEIVKKCLCIDTDSWDEYSDSFDYIRLTVASIHPLLGFSRQEIESIKKALEVEDE